jgi:hypothetical protein
MKVLPKARHWYKPSRNPNDFYIPWNDSEQALLSDREGGNFFGGWSTLNGNGVRSFRVPHPWGLVYQRVRFFTLLFAARLPPGG